MIPSSHKKPSAVDGVAAGVFIDKRADMPRGIGGNGAELHWPLRRVVDILGVCIHQNGSNNFTGPIGTANYHTSPDNHITPGRALPSICYNFCIPDTDDLPWLTEDMLSRTYAQNAVCKNSPVQMGNGELLCSSQMVCPSAVCHVQECRCEQSSQKSSD